MNPTDQKPTISVTKSRKLVKNTRHTEAINSVAISPNDKYILTGSADGTAKLWMLDTGELIRTITGHKGEVTVVVFSPDGKYILTGSQDKTVKVWATLSGKLIETWTLYSGVSSIAFSPSGATIAVGGEAGLVDLFWNNSFEPSNRAFAAHPFRAILDIAFFPNGEWLMTGAEGGDIFVWEVVDTKSRKKFGGVFTARYSKKVPIEDIYSIEVFADGKRVLTGSCDNEAKIWDVETGEVITTFAGHKDCVVSVRLSPDGKQVLTASRDGRVKIWEVETGKLLKTIVAHTHWISSAVFSANGKYVLTGSLDHSAKLWEVASGKLKQTY
jgi:WD40 repeat protein